MYNNVIGLIKNPFWIVFWSKQQDFGRPNLQIKWDVGTLHSILLNVQSSCKDSGGPEATHHGKLFNDPHMPLKEKREHIKWSDNWEHLKPDWL